MKPNMSGLPLTFKRISGGVLVEIAPGTKNTVLIPDLVWHWIVMNMEVDPGIVSFYQPTRTTRRARTSEEEDRPQTPLREPVRGSSSREAKNAGETPSAVGILKDGARGKSEGSVQRPSTVQHREVVTGTIDVYYDWIAQAWRTKRGMEIKISDAATSENKREDDSRRAEGVLDEILFSDPHVLQE